MARTSQPHETGVVGDNDNVVCHNSVNSGGCCGDITAENSPQHVPNMVSRPPVHPFPIGNVARSPGLHNPHMTRSRNVVLGDPAHFRRSQSPQSGGSSLSMERSRTAGFQSNDHGRRMHNDDSIPLALQRNTRLGPYIDSGRILNVRGNSPFSGQEGTTTSGDTIMADAVQSSRVSGSVIERNLLTIGNVSGNQVGRQLNDHGRMMCNDDSIAVALQHNALVKAQFGSGSILNLRGSAPFSDNLGTTMSGDAIMANAIQSSWVSGPIIERNLLTNRNGSNSQVGLQLNDQNRTEHFSSGQGNQGIFSLPINHASVMGVASGGAGLNPSISPQTPQACGQHQVSVPNNQFIGFQSAGDMRYMNTVPNESLYYHPAASSSQSMRIQSAGVNNEQSWQTILSRAAPEPCVLSEDPNWLSLSLRKHQLLQQQQQQQQRFYPYNFMGLDAGALTPQILNPCHTSAPFPNLIASAQDEESNKSVRCPQHQQQHAAAVRSRLTNHNTLIHSTSSPVVGNIDGIAAQNHSEAVQSRMANHNALIHSTASPVVGSINGIAAPSHSERPSIADQGDLPQLVKDKLVVDNRNIVQPIKDCLGQGDKGKAIQRPLEGKRRRVDESGHLLSAMNKLVADNRNLVQRLQTTKDPLGKGDKGKAIQKSVEERPGIKDEGGLLRSARDKLVSDNRRFVQPINKGRAIQRSVKGDVETISFLAGYNCFVCKRDVQLTPTGPVTMHSDLLPVSVLSCGHVFHEECLLKITPPEQAADPPCIPCAMGEK